MSERAAGILMPISVYRQSMELVVFQKAHMNLQIGSKEQDRVTGRSFHLDRPVMEIHHISPFLHLQGIRILSVWMN